MIKKCKCQKIHWKLISADKEEIINQTIKAERKSRVNKEIIHLSFICIKLMILRFSI